MMRMVAKRKYEETINFCTCAVCLGVCKDPVQCENGCIGCRACFQRIVDASPTKKFNCPLCRSSQQFFPNLFMKTHLLTTTIKCANEAWNGKPCGKMILVGEVETHDQTCPLKIIPCKNNEYGCTFTSRRKQMASHEKECIWSTMIKCSTCKLKFQYGTHIDCHLSGKECVKCGEVVSHGSLLIHKSTCVQEDPVCFWPGCAHWVPSTDHLKRNPVHRSVDGLVLADYEKDHFQFASISFVLPTCPGCKMSLNTNCKTCTLRNYTLPPLKINTPVAGWTAIQGRVEVALEDENAKIVTRLDLPAFENTKLCMIYAIEVIIGVDNYVYAGIKTKVRKTTGGLVNSKLCKLDGIPENNQIALLISVGISNHSPPEDFPGRMHDFLKTPVFCRNVTRHMNTCKWVPAGSLDYALHPHDI